MPTSAAGVLGSCSSGKWRLLRIGDSTDMRRLKPGLQFRWQPSAAAVQQDLSMERNESEWKASEPRGCHWACGKQGLFLGKLRAAPATPGCVGGASCLGASTRVKSQSQRDCISIYLHTPVAKCHNWSPWMRFIRSASIKQLGAGKPLPSNWKPSRGY